MVVISTFMVKAQTGADNRSFGTLLSDTNLPKNRLKS